MRGPSAVPQRAFARAPVVVEPQRDIKGAMVTLLTAAAMERLRIPMGHTDVARLRAIAVDVFDTHKTKVPNAASAQAMVDEMLTKVVEDYRRAEREAAAAQ